MAERRRGDDGEIERLVMEKIALQIGPLEKRVEKFDSTLQRLFNTNGGPEGFLQSARREDNVRFDNEKNINDGRFDMIFNMLQEFKDAIKPVTTFIASSQSKEEQKNEDIKSLEKRSTTRLVILGLVFSAISIISANMQGCRNAAHSFFSPDQGHSAVHFPQTSDSR